MLRAQPSRSTRGRVLEAFLKAERDLASCGRGSQPRTREVRETARRVLRPGCEEDLATAFGANAGGGSTRTPEQKAPRWSAGRRADRGKGPRRALPARHSLRPRRSAAPHRGAGKKLQNPDAAASRERSSLFDIVRMRILPPSSRASGVSLQWLAALYMP
jgi:hypothetical protein